MGVPPADASNAQPFDIRGFRIVGRLGAGAMGTVWDARHRDTGVAVAIKTATVAGAGEAAAFDREALAMAQLDHPRVVAILERGRTTAAESEASGGRVPAGAPWLAMERANGGTLRQGLGSVGFVEVRALLVQVLDALAHAHARGVLHRDIKPSNILVHREHGRVQLLLSDFGIAEALRGDRTVTESSGGTPGYMAPEQIVGDVAHQGPWSDLYGLGCVAWEMLTGRRPFRGDDVTEVLNAQLDGVPPSFVPRLAVPEGFEEWLRAMIAVPFQRRFARAADAAWSLASLSDAPLGSDHDAGFDLDTPTLVATMRLLGSASPSSDARAGGTERRLEVPPMPSAPFLDARGPRASRIPAGLGASLFGIRAARLWGRDEAITQLWEELREASRSSTVRAVLLEGGEGVGKGHVCRRLCQRAHELGAASFLHLAHVRGADAQAPVAGALAEAFRCADRDRARAAQHLGERFAARHDAESLVRAAVQLIVPSHSPDHLGMMFRTATERHAAVARVLSVMAEERPVVVWADDLDLGEDTIALFRFLLRRRQDLPVLLLGTVRPDRLAELPEAGRQLTDLRAQDRVRSVALGALDPEAAEALIADLFPLRPSSASELAHRSEGVPLVARHLLTHLVETGGTVEAPGGYRLAEGLRLPEGPQELWRMRLRAVAGEDDGAWCCLEIASVLAPEIDRVLLERACALADVAVPEGLEAALVSRGLATETPRGWTFSTSRLADASKRSAQDRGRWARWNDACGRALREAGPRHAARAAEAFEAAGRIDDAARCALDAISFLQASGEHSAAVRAAGRLSRLLERSGIGPADERWRRCQDLWLTALVYMGAEAVAEAAERALRVQPLAPDDPGIALAISRIESLRDEPLEAHRQARLALEGFQRARDDVGRARALRTLAGQEVSIGWLDAAAESITSLRALEHVLDESERAQARFAEARLAAAAGDEDRADHAIARSLELYVELGDRVGQGLCWNLRAELHRVEGRLERAEHDYARAGQVFDEAASQVGKLVDLNLGLLRVQQGRGEEARRMFDELWESVRPHPVAAKLRRSIEHGLLGCAALAGDWPAFDRHLDAALASGPRRLHVSRDLAVVAEAAASRAEAAGEPERARRAWELAAAHWAPLDSLAHARAVARSNRAG